MKKQVLILLLILGVGNLSAQIVLPAYQGVHFSGFICGHDSITDYDGNRYPTVEIGEQCWMAENLSVTHYSDGTPIPHVTDNTEWGNLEDNNTDDAYCYYNNNPEEETSIYGALYTWAAAMGDNAVSSSSNPSGVQGACPDGWHLPSDDEWTQMEIYLADNGHNYDGTIGGGRAKIAKSLAYPNGWYSCSGTGTVGNSDFPTYRNKSGFSCHPCGYRFINGAFNSRSEAGFFWCASEYDTGNAWYRSIYYCHTSVYRYSINKSRGFSVRCVKD
jgi:uncharacterized protein (TIGR02145 family)